MSFAEGPVIFQQNKFESQAWSTAPRIREELRRAFSPHLEKSTRIKSATLSTSAFFDHFGKLSSVNAAKKKKIEKADLANDDGYRDQPASSPGKCHYRKKSAVSAFGLFDLKLQAHFRKRLLFPTSGFVNCAGLPGGGGGTNTAGRFAFFANVDPFWESCRTSKLWRYHRKTQYQPEWRRTKNKPTASPREL